MKCVKYDFKGELLCVTIITQVVVRFKPENLKYKHVLSKLPHRS